MKLLQEAVRRYLIEGQRFDDFQSWLQSQNMADHVGDWGWEAMKYGSDFSSTYLSTMHKDHLRKNLKARNGIPVESPKFGQIDDDVDQYFQNRRGIKRYWNENCDREFWQGPKMRYFHSLMYYGYGVSDQLVQNVSNEIGCQDLSLIGFAQQYKMSGNRDEMSTWGVFNGSCATSNRERSLGLELEGRVTLATVGDGMVESRSKATPVDQFKHVGSGLPKRPSTSKEYTDKLLFDEEDIRENGKIEVGECILDNWSVKAIWYDPRAYSYDEIDGFEAFGDALGIPVGDVRTFIKRKIHRV